MGLFGAIFGGLRQEHSATRAANTQAAAAEQAQGLLKSNQQNALDFQNNEWEQQQQNEAPFLELGQTAAGRLNEFSANPFTAPTEAEAAATPGYQFTLDQGIGALDKSAAARGNLFSGTQGTDLEKYATGLADSTYNDVYNRALNTYMTNYNTLMGETGVGQNAAAQLGSEGQAAAGNVSNLDLIGGSQQAQQINNAAAARASGYIGRANATSQMFNNVDQQLNDAAMLMALNG